MVPNADRGDKQQKGLFKTQKCPKSTGGGTNLKCQQTLVLDKLKDHKEQMIIKKKNDNTKIKNPSTRWGKGDNNKKQGGGDTDTP